MPEEDVDEQQLAEAITALSENEKPSIMLPKGQMRVTKDSFRVVAPPRPDYNGAEFEPRHGEELGGPVHFMKSKPNRMGIQLTARDEGGAEMMVQHTGASFEPDPTPERPTMPYSARKMDAFGDDELAQIINFRASQQYKTMHLYRTDLPDGVMAIQVEDGPIHPHIVILVQKYQVWEQNPAWKALVTIDEENSWAIGGNKVLDKHIGEFMKAVWKRHKKQ